MLPWKRPGASRLVAMRAEHAEDCANIHAESFAHPWRAEEIAGLIAAASSFGAVALDPAKSNVRGFVLSRQGADEAEILTIAISSAWRGYGIGREMLAEHLRQAALRGVREMFLEVDPENAAAIALYAKYGFVRVGERKNYYPRRSAPMAAASIMRRSLD